MQPHAFTGKQLVICCFGEQSVSEGILVGIRGGNQHLAIDSFPQPCQQGLTTQL
jgi:hypothetical protein